MTGPKAYNYRWTLVSRSCLYFYAVAQRHSARALCQGAPMSLKAFDAVLEATRSGRPSKGRLGPRKATRIRPPDRTHHVSNRRRERKTSWITRHRWKIGRSCNGGVNVRTANAVV